MATNMATQLATKGPLGSALAQWIFIGFGTIVIFTGDNGVSKAAQEISRTLLRLVAGNSAALLRETSLSSRGFIPQQPIVIHNVSPSNESSNYSARNIWYLVQISMGAGGCWAAYVVFSQLLPESIKELLPVTRQFFDQAVTSLGKGIIRVRDVLSEQISILGLKQDELATKQDNTHDAVLDLKKDVGDVRLNIDDIAIAISRCEGSLTDAAGRQNYMSRGVRLLVQCVGDILRPSNPAVADELEQFSRLSEEMDGDFHYRDNAGKPSTPVRRSKIEYPSSPNISEIGSVSANAVDDVRPMTLPQSSLSLTTPPLRDCGTSTCIISPSPFGQSSMMSMRSKSMSRQASCPENEVPASEKESIVRLDEVDQLLARIRSGAI